MSEHIPQLSMNELKTVVRSAFLANTVVCVMGPPGVGKSAIAEQLTVELGAARNMHFNFIPLEAGLVPIEEMGGLAMKRQDGQVIRAPLSPIWTACQTPSVLFLDEITRCNKDKLGLLLTGIQDRRFGDSRLHPETRIILAGNYGESGGTHGLIDAFINRVCLVGLKPKVEDFLQWLGQVVPGQVVAPYRQATQEDCDLFLDFAATAQKAPNLINFEVPEGAEEKLLSWASPRAIVNGLLTYRHVIGTPDEKTGTGRAVLAGFIGTDAATAYLVIRQLRDRLASIEDILKDPLKARVPSEKDMEAGIAALGIISVASRKDADATAIYCNRILMPEIRAVLIRQKMLLAPKGGGAALEAYKELASSVGNALSRANSGSRKSA